MGERPCKNHRSHPAVPGTKDCDPEMVRFNGKTKPVCPYCGTPLQRQTPHPESVFVEKSWKLSGQMITGLYGVERSGHYMHGMSTDPDCS